MSDSALENLYALDERVAAFEATKMLDRMCSTGKFPAVAAMMNEINLDKVGAATVLAFMNYAKLMVDRKHLQQEAYESFRAKARAALNTKVGAERTDKLLAGR